MRPLHEDDVHEHLREEARRFALNEIAPHVRAWEEAGTFPRELYGKLAQAGLMGVGYAEELGGAGGDLTHMLAVQHELLRHGGSAGVVAGLGTHAIALPPILRHGTPEQRARFVPPVLRGEHVAALAVTEPGGGSDVASVATRAVRDGDFYVVNGAKTFITSGTRADIVTAAVRTGGPGAGGLSVLVVERGTPGFEASAPLRKMGWWASDTAELHFDGCRVPAANLVGGENEGFAILAANFATERLLLAANAVAIAQLAYAESVAWAKERSAFGRKLAGFQVTRHKLADMATRIAAARALANDVAARVVAGEEDPGLCAMAKNAATDACLAVCDEAVQIFGGTGYMRDTTVERLYRDARLYPIGGGTREIMNEIISKTEGY